MISHKTVRVGAVFLFGALSLSRVANSQESEVATPAAPIIQKILEDQGIDSAVDKLQQLLADSADSYEFDFRQMRFAARWLGWKDRRSEKQAMLEKLTVLFPENPNGWADLGWEHLLVGDSDLAAELLSKSLEIEPDNPHAAWQLEHLDDLLMNSARQRAVHAKYEPGQSIGREGPYLGEQPPGDVPQVFAPGIVSDLSNEFSINFSPDGKEIYFSRSGFGVMVCRWTPEGWTAPEVVRFFDSDFSCDEPSISSDGQWIYFNARPTIMNDRVVYRAPRKGDSWGKPEKLFVGMYPTAANDGTLFYTEITGRPDYGKIACREKIESGYSEPHIVDGEVNTSRIDAHPYIAPDKSLMLFDSNRSGETELYVCFRHKDGTWGDAIVLNNQLGIPGFAGQCTLSPDGKYLFFSLNDDIYWVNAQFLRTLKPM